MDYDAKAGPTLFRVPDLPMWPMALAPPQKRGHIRTPVSSLCCQPLVAQLLHELHPYVGDAKCVYPRFRGRSEKPYPGREGTITPNASAEFAPQLAGSREVARAVKSADETVKEMTVEKSGQWISRNGRCLSNRSRKNRFRIPTP